MNSIPAFLLWSLVVAQGIPSAAIAGTTDSPQIVNVIVTDGGTTDLSPAFLGLSYETGAILPKEGHYFFDARNQALVNIFRTLGIRSLRVGGATVDNPKIPLPTEQDVDMLFGFARAAGVKVIYSFRLGNGDPAYTARMAAYIQSRYGDLLDSFAIGNEPESLKEFKTSQYDVFYAAWKQHYDAILKAVPQARIEGPSTNKNAYALNLARDLFSQGHLSMVSTHCYPFGDGRKEKDPAAMRGRFLSDKDLVFYGKLYANIGGPLAAQGVPYRIDEMNSCWGGGAKDASDTYASTLWALDWTHWWAARHIAGINYHTGTGGAGMNGKYKGPIYTSFLGLPDDAGIEVHPIAYSHLAFTQGAQGRPVGVRMDKPPRCNLTAYAYRQTNGACTVTLINKSYGDSPETASVSVKLPASAASGSWRQLRLLQKDQDIAAKTDITLGGASIDSLGNWPGRWEELPATSAGRITVQIPAASATILKFGPGG